MFIVLPTPSFMTAKQAGPASWTPGRHYLATICVRGADLALAEECVR